MQNKSGFTAEISTDPLLKTKVIILGNSTSDPQKNLEVRIAPELGSNLFSFTSGDKQIIFCDPKLLVNRDWTGCFVLWPLPNRVKNKEFEFEGKHYSLSGIKRRSGNFPLIHGLVDDQVWEYENPTTDDTSARVKTKIAITKDSPLFNYFPFASRLTLEYILTDTGVKINYAVENLGESNLPFGFALHPYFSLLSGMDNTHVSLPATAVMEADAELLPSGELSAVQNTPFDLRSLTPVAKLNLDHVFTNLEARKSAVIDYPNQHLQLNLNASADFTHLVIYTMEKDKGFICLENQTGATDMINLHTQAIKEGNKELEKAAHLLVLPPHQTHTGFIEYVVKPTEK